MAAAKTMTTITPELKAQAVKMVTTYASAIKVAEKFGIPEDLLRTWKWASIEAANLEWQDAAEMAGECDLDSVEGKKVMQLFEKFMKEGEAYFWTSPKRRSKTSG